MCANIIYPQLQDCTSRSMLFKIYINPHAGCHHAALAGLHTQIIYILYFNSHGDTPLRTPLPDPRLAFKHPHPVSSARDGRAVKWRKGSAGE